MMKSLEESSAAKHQRLTRQDMMQTMQTGGPSSVKIEVADGVKVKKEKGAEQEVSFESQDKGGDGDWIIFGCRWRARSRKR